MLGTTLHHYRIVGRLGAGGMGEVYAAEDTKLDRRVALKLLPPDMAADPERLQRFEREARAVAALNHPNIVTIHAVEEASGLHFLAMELVEGKTLSQLIPAGGLPLADLLAIAVPLVDAVAFAHRHGIVHRDLKPANIMLGDDGRLKVLDFGLAKLRRPATGLRSVDTTRLATLSLTEHQEILGTPWYMSPEQAEGRPVDHRSDIFSLGVVIYEMASGRRPFVGDTAVSVISSIIKDTPAPLSEVKPRLPPSLGRIVSRALAKDPASRYQDARDMHDDLQRVQEKAEPARALVTVARVLAGSRAARWLAVAALLVAAVSTAAWFLLRPGAGDTSNAPAPARFQTTRLSAAPGLEQYPSLLPDGKWVLYVGSESGNRDIFLLSTSGQNPMNLTRDSSADDDEPAASPDGERIAFRSSREGGGIFVMGRTGEGVRRVTPRGVAAFNPAWSPDGTQLVYATEDVQLTPLNWEGLGELWVVDVAGGGRRKLQVEDAVQPAWSPGGHRIAYVSRGQRGTGGEARRVMDIHTIPAGGGEPVAATNDLATDWNPVWSHDGRHVYFVSDRGGSMNLWRVPIDERTGRRLGEPEPLTTPAPFLAHPTVSADGRRLAYSAVSQTSNVQRLELDAATGAVKGAGTWVTTGTRMWVNPDPSPDGEWVVFYSRDQPEGDLYVCRADGSRLRQLTGDAAIDRVPRWSPDQTWIAFFSNRGGPLQVWKIRAADGSDLQLVGNGSIAAWSPDGRRIANRQGIVDSSRPLAEQQPETMPDPRPELPGFIPNDWSPDGRRLAGQLSFSDRGGEGIALYTFATRAYERLTDFGEWPAWFPDSRRLLFVNRGSEFWVFDTRTRQATKIYTSDRDVLGPPRLTRDGRLAYFSRRVTEGDIYLLTFE